MKKSLFFFIYGFIALSVSAQDGVISKGNPIKSENNKKIETLKKNVIIGTKSVPGGVPIGMTNYDLQTNSAIDHRLINHGDGKLSAVWTQYQGTTLPSAPQRGTGYNYFNGSSWLFGATSGNVRIEGTTRTGWPSIVSNGTDEYVINHGAATGAYGWTQAEGTSNTAWTARNMIGSQGLFWPRAAASGNYVHTISVVNNDDPYLGQQPSPMYSRSSDFGLSWGTQMTQIDGMDQSFFNAWSGDSYAIDAKGSTVAFVVFSDLADMVMWKSNDNGDSWAKTIINDFPIDLYDDAGGTLLDYDSDGIADSCYSTGGSGDIAIDNNGKVHVVFTRMRYLDTEPSVAGYSFFPYTDYVMYWNEDRGAGTFQGMTGPSLFDFGTAQLDTIGWVPDLNENGDYDFPTVGAGEYPFGMYYDALSCMPNIGVDADNNLYVAYATVMEGDQYLNATATPNAQQYKHVFITKRCANGTWNAPVDVTTIDGANAENVYPSLARLVDANVHLMVQWDGEPGVKLKEDTDPTTDNYMIYKAIPVAEFGTCSVAVNDKKLTGISVYPNPTSQYVNVTGDNLVKISIYNILGSEVLTVNADNNLKTVDLTQYPVGTYILKIYTTDGVITQKVQKI